MENIETLKMFFAISNAAFEFQHAISKALTGKDYPISGMHELHILAKMELDKKDPDLDLIDSLLKVMEKNS